MGKLYPYSTGWKKNIVVVLHIYGARPMSLIFFYHQDTESESCEMEIGVAGFQRLYGTMILIIYKMGEKHCGNDPFLELEPFS